MAPSQWSPQQPALPAAQASRGRRPQGPSPSAPPAAPPGQTARQRGQPAAARSTRPPRPRQTATPPRAARCTARGRTTPAPRQRAALCAWCTTRACQGTPRCVSLGAVGLMQGACMGMVFRGAQAPSACWPAAHPGGALPAPAAAFQLRLTRPFRGCAVPTAGSGSMPVSGRASPRSTPATSHHIHLTPAEQLMSGRLHEFGDSRGIVAGALGGMGMRCFGSQGGAVSGRQGLGPGHAGWAACLLVFCQP